MASSLCTAIKLPYIFPVHWFWDTLPAPTPAAQWRLCPVFSNVHSVRWQWRSWHHLPCGLHEAPDVFTQTFFGYCIIPFFDWIEFRISISKRRLVWRTQYRIAGGGVAVAGGAGCHNMVTLHITLINGTSHSIPTSQDLVFSLKLSHSLSLSF